MLYVEMSQWGTHSIVCGIMSRIYAGMQAAPWQLQASLVSQHKESPHNPLPYSHFVCLWTWGQSRLVCSYGATSMCGYSPWLACSWLTFWSCAAFPVISFDLSMLQHSYEVSSYCRIGFHCCFQCVPEVLNTIRTRHDVITCDLLSSHHKHGVALKRHSQANPIQMQHTFKVITDPGSSPIYMHQGLQ